MLNKDINRAITLYDDNGINSQAIRWMIAELGLSIRNVSVLEVPEPMRAINPAGILPMLAVQHHCTLYDAIVIVDYLAERYPEPLLLPADIAQRALIRLTLLRFQQFFLPAYQCACGDGRNAIRARRDLFAALRELSPACNAGRFLLGAEMSAMDFFYGVLIYQMVRRWGLPKELKPLQNYLGRLLEMTRLRAVL